ncbi:SelT/selW/selH selenoprotein [Chitinophaga caeni]|uniref:SelT/selW/selH selenoprotein n=2 Tax=Chitinophaga caeni TaxID=2029983 RepID=A0A291QVQ8_9BACT|nr:SelT/selW/selH selenoprotein [Chitinophaga caeni]
MPTGTFMELQNKPGITIRYCPKCGWLLRAAYMAQELLTTFEEDLSAVSLQPAEIAGSYQVLLDQVVLFDRKRDGQFPEIKQLKQTVRDHVNPGKSLGHSDRKPV